MKIKKKNLSSIITITLISVLSLTSCDKPCECDGEQIILTSAPGVGTQIISATGGDGIDIGTMDCDLDDKFTQAGNAGTLLNCKDTGYRATFIF